MNRRTRVVTATVVAEVACALAKACLAEAVGRERRKRRADWEMGMQIAQLHHQGEKRMREKERMWQAG
jgi:hypothetical protein